MGTCSVRDGICKAKRLDIGRGGGGGGNPVKKIFL